MTFNVSIGKTLLIKGEKGYEESIPVHFKEIRIKDDCIIFMSTASEEKHWFVILLEEEDSLDNVHLNLGEIILLLSNFTGLLGVYGFLKYYNLNPKSIDFRSSKVKNSLLGSLVIKYILDEQD